MKKTVLAAMLSLASIGAHAGTYEISLTDISFKVVDVTPGDGNLPKYTITSGSLETLLSPVDIHDVWGVFDTAVLPPSTGEPMILAGLLYPGTQLVWTASGHLSFSVIDVDMLWDWEEIEVRTGFFSAPHGEQSGDYMELNMGLQGQAGTFQRITTSFDFGVTVRATNLEWDVPVPYEIGWFNQYHTQSFSTTPPIPEPSTYAMVLGGLAATLGVRRRALTRGKATAGS